MGSIKAHIYLKEHEAKSAIDIINNGEGIPKNENSVTTTYTNYQSQNGEFYIQADSVTEKYLGEPIDYEIIEDEI